MRNQMRNQRKAKRGCCPACNSQILCSYVLALLSTALVVGGGYLAVKKWDHTWLILSMSGTVLMFIGSCMYYCGNLALAEVLREECVEDGDESVYRRRSGRTSQKQRSKSRGYNDRASVNERHLGDSRSVSQLSLNMIPQYFSNAETSPPQSHVNVRAPSPNMNYSQIFSVNGQSFLILPLSGDNIANNEECSIPMQNLFLKIPNSTNNSSVRKKDERGANRAPNNAGTPRQVPRREAQNIFESECSSETQRIQPREEQINFPSIATSSGGDYGVIGNRRIVNGVDVSMRAPSSSRLKRKRSHSETARNQLHRHSAAIVGFVHDQDTSSRSRNNAQTQDDEPESYTPASSENTPLIASCSRIGQSEPSQSTPAEHSSHDTVIQNQTFTDEVSEAGEAAVTGQASTPPPSYEEVLSVDQETETEDQSLPGFGTV